MSRPTTRALTLLVLAVALTAGPSAAAQSTEPVSPEAFAARLDAAIAQLEQTPSESRTPDALQAAVASLGLPATVSMPDGEQRVVTEGSLFAGIDVDGGSAAWDAVTERLHAARDLAGAAASVSPRDDATVRAAVAAAYGGTDTEPGIVQRILRRIRDAIGWLLDHTVGALMRSGPLGALLASLLLAGLVVLVAARVGRRVVPDQHGPEGAAGGGAPIDWAALAQRAIDAGDPDGAVRALYHLLLETLDRRGIVEEAPSLTAGECRAAVQRRRPALEPTVRGATETFERVAYGNVEADDDDVDRLVGAERAARSA